MALGLDALTETETYVVQTRFDWHGAWGLMPMNALPGNKGKQMEMRLATGTFDGQVEWLEGRREGLTRGLQSWQGYRQRDDEALVQRGSARTDWGIATYHYLLEAPLNARGAEIVRYAGETTFEGEDYDLVYVTWGSVEPNREFDRFLLYIHQDTRHLDLMEVTINDFFLPMPRGMQHATAFYAWEETDIGAYMPSHLTFQLKGARNPRSHVYALTLEDYAFDSIPVESLYPIEGLPFYGQAKELPEDPMMLSQR